MTKPTTAEIRDALVRGDRGPVNDADEIVGSDGLEQIECLHDGSDGRVALNYSFRTAFDGNEEIDIYNDDPWTDE